MPMKAMAAVVAVAAGEKLDVSQVCRDSGISRKTFYKWVARCRAEGLEGLQERSRRPHHCPAQTGVEVEDAVVRLRKELAEAGLDHGATTIQWHLGRRRQPGDPAVPSVATIHRILVRRGLVVPEPRKRPRVSWRRFEAPAPNEWWQIDATTWVTAAGPVEVFNIVDDHSRLACRSRAMAAATGEEAWETFIQAAQRWGLPAGVLSDNGLCFSGKLRGFEVLFEARLRDAGIRPFTGRPYHPQTTGKVERFQQTLKRWLRRQDHRCGLARDITDLQARLDEFVDHYNTQRPHQGIGRVTPLSRWQATAASSAADRPLAHPAPRLRHHTVTVNAGGVIDLADVSIGVGARWSGSTVTITLDGTYATITANTELVRHLRIDHTRYYQPTGRPRGGPRQPRHLPS